MPASMHGHKPEPKAECCAGYGHRGTRSLRLHPPLNVSPRQPRSDLNTGVQLIGCDRGHSGSFELCHMVLQHLSG